jgi:hypothetical protein
MRLDPARFQAFDEGLGVIVLVGAKRRTLGQPLAQGRRLAFRWFSLMRRADLSGRKCQIEIFSSNSSWIELGVTGWRPSPNL